MIRGLFRQEGRRRRAFLTTYVEIPDLQSSGHVALLVDTGADSTLLAPRDASLLGIDPQGLTSGPPSTGVGGLTRTVYVTASITLDHLNYEHTLRILAPTSRQQQRALSRIPSLLGRDILSRFALFMEERTGRVLLLEPHESDNLNLPE